MPDTDFQNTAFVSHDITRENTQQFLQALDRIRSDPKEKRYFELLTQKNERTDNYIKTFAKLMLFMLSRKAYADDDVWKLRTKYTNEVRAICPDLTERNWEFLARRLHFVRKDLKNDFKRLEVESLFRKTESGNRFLHTVFEESLPEDFRFLCYLMLYRASLNTHKAEEHKENLCAACFLFATDLAYYCDFDLNKAEQVLYTPTSSSETFESNRRANKTVFSNLPTFASPYDDGTYSDPYENAQFKIVLDYAVQEVFDIVHFKQKYNVYDVNEVRNLFNDDDMKLFLHKLRIFDLDYTAKNSCS